MHTLRYVIGDEIFFLTLKKLATDTQYTYHNFVTTDDVEKLFTNASGKNLKPLFDIYLRTTNKLEVLVKQTSDKTYNVSLQNFDMLLPIEVTTSSGAQRMEIGNKPVRITSDKMPVIDEKVYYLKRVILE